MSLLLRQEVQKDLDDAGLGVLHVGIDGRLLALHGECGQRLLSIGGISFASAVPKAKEIPFAAELFRKFLAKHKDAIIEYIDAKRAASSLLLPEVPEGWGSRVSQAVLIPPSGQSGGLEFRKTDGDAPAVSFTSVFRPIGDLKRLLAEAEELLPTAEAFYADLFAYNEAQKRARRLGADIGTCDI
ncbi:MAG: hypothetical protein U9Q38_06385 [Thermodesulfobacteriota bacterium]|nr:hypothetical protein [Thermodesulfobacteriota bacterium]